MNALLNVLADFDSVKFHVSLIVAVISMCILIWAIEVGQVF